MNTSQSNVNNETDAAAAYPETAQWTSPPLQPESGPRHVRVRTVVAGVLTIAFSVLMLLAFGTNVSVNSGYVLLAVVIAAGLALLVSGIRNAKSANRNSPASHG